VIIIGKLPKIWIEKGYALSSCRIAFLNVMDGFSGGEIVLKRIIEGLDDEKFEKLVYTRRTKFFEEIKKTVEKTIPIEEVYQLRTVRGFKGAIKALSLFFVSAKYAYHMKSNSIDIVHSNSLTSSLYFAFWAKIFGLKFIAYNHLIRRGWIYKIIYKYIYFYSDRVVCVSEAVKKCWIDEGIPEKKIVVVYNGLPDDFF